MTNKDLIETAMKQSAVDMCCTADDFTKKENIIVSSYKSDSARIYLELPFICNLVTYGSNIVASVGSGHESAVKQYLDGTDVMHCFETPSLYRLNELIKPHGAVCFMAEYWLPDLDILQALPIRYETRVLHQEDFAQALAISAADKYA